MNDFSDLINWRVINDTITTSGQPTEAQLARLAQSGVRHIVNLGPHHNKGALDDEPASVAALGMVYTYIPVTFQRPTDADFTAFCQALDAVGDQRTHVHCIYNARVSAFFYRYAKTGRGLPVDQAFALMDGIWRPGQDWAAFIDEDAALGQLNRYAGEDYESDPCQI